MLVVGILLSAFQQLVGINAVLYYGPQMFANMGFKGDASFAQTVIMGIVMVVFTLIATVTVDKWGRKPLLILGAIIMAVSMIALGFMFHVGSVGLGALIVVCIYIAGFSLSWGPVVWVMLAEIFPNSIRDKAMAIAVAAQWFMNWVVTGDLQHHGRQHGSQRPRSTTASPTGCTVASACWRRCSSGSSFRRARACRSRTCRSSGRSRRPERLPDS